MQLSLDIWCSWAGSLAAAGREGGNWVTILDMQVRAIGLSHTPVEKIRPYNHEEVSLLMYYGAEGESVRISHSGKIKTPRLCNS